ncbi:hypothetical protein V2I80_24415 [Pseudomonas viridiflava]|uniref:hypothetical protein n=1 Tax=Pseudomonas viridiflava TaxID=33069 RepID=UPI002EA7F382|nr:hypothetical protein [Pseudomonas viridiflava]MEE3975685.1 hypothetical protein [Pseudomonas viridiflava]MEE4020708.1 hypothetical protein [Pseudomonas viridiflava]MEE4048605.1 hypothetical protein [Pseudomonas viridiflava]
MILLRRRPKTVWDVKEDQFIRAANSLKTLQVPLRGCISIDPEEIRDQIIAAREAYKSLVRRGD